MGGCRWLLPTRVCSRHSRGCFGVVSSADCPPFSAGALLPSPNAGAPAGSVSTSVDDEDTILGVEDATAGAVIVVELSRRYLDPTLAQTSVPSYRVVQISCACTCSARNDLMPLSRSASTSTSVSMQRQ